MSKEKQIEKMACEKCLHHLACLTNSEYVPTPCPAYEDKAGYRKQSEGEWKICSDGYYPYCSRCNHEPKNGVMSDFCPSCGAYMKGGAE
jgi:hypothetical protein